ncbi:MAG: 2-oxoacid:acceptor oxidoreductase subunit alpha [Bacteroidales bacterium]|nr:2-oxoacid:acceptor oxidoreductase subunit alpha [Bacteroidales bacterium]
MKKDISIVLSGEAGQGIRTVELLIIKALKNSGYNVFSTSEFMSRVRGGNNTTEIRVSNKNIQAFVDKIDILIVLSKDAIKRIENRLTKNTIIIGEDSFIEEKYKNGQYKIKDVALRSLSKEIGGLIYSNVLIFGLLAGIFNINLGLLKDYIIKHFSAKGKDIIDNNIKAVTKGYEKGKELKLGVQINKDAEIKNKIVISGTESIGIGALAGGCNFITAYPMSPSTGVIQFLAKHSEEFGVVVEQAEDEISAINMVQGAWYAGARAMTTTSGGGFALMEEGISLSGIAEVPVVIHLAQRPGPATGLPTRTEQGDLNLALYAGHGEFPRIIFAPGNFKDGICLTQKAFNLADKYQVPVIILTDQFFIDSYQCIEKIDFSNFKIQNYITKTGKDYIRYKNTEDGISPRGIPSYGEGFVRFDSHEHDEEGFITEDFDIRKKMVDKRFKKLELISKESIDAEIIGSGNYKTIIAGWGSTYGVIKEAIEELNNNDIAFVYFKQVYPLPKNTIDILSRAKRRIIIENNATSQFGKLIKTYTGIEFDRYILKYDGTPFSLEEIINELKSII